MNIVTDNLDQIIDAPDGIKRLRELILQLAVQGKLVEQRPEEGTANELLQQIAEAKRTDAEARKARGERVRKAKVLPLLEADEVPFKISSDWKWVRLDDVYDVRDGTHDSPKYQPSGYPLVTSKNLSSGRLDISNVKFISKEDHEKICERSKVDLEDILFAMIGSIGNPVIVDIEPEFSIKNVALFKYHSREYVEPRYLLKYLEYAAEHMRNTADGGVQSFVSLTRLRTYPHPLPPLAEQKRIVAKVDELMAWCDELEALKQKRDALQKASLKATLHELVGTDRRAVRASVESLPPSGALGEHALPSDPSKFDIPCSLFDILRLIQKPEQVKQLRDAILQLAVQGRLVEQRESDGTATDLLKEIEAAKAADLERRKAAGERIRKAKVLPPIDPDEIPFDIPQNWEWVRIRSIFSDVGQKVPDQTFCYVDVSAINKERGVVTADAVKVLESADAPSRARKLVCKGSVIYSTVRPYLLNIAVIEDDFELEPIVSTAFAVLKPWAGTSEHLLYYYLRSTAFTEYVESKQKGVAYPAISESEFNIGLYPLPPLAEQQRIVGKVDELMAFCDDLETLLQTASDTATRFAAAIACIGRGYKTL